MPKYEFTMPDGQVHVMEGENPQDAYAQIKYPTGSNRSTGETVADLFGVRDPTNEPGALGTFDRFGMSIGREAAGAVDRFGRAVLPRALSHYFPSDPIKRFAEGGGTSTEERVGRGAADIVMGGMVPEFGLEDATLGSLIKNRGALSPKVWGPAMTGARVAEGMAQGGTAGALTEGKGGIVPGALGGGAMSGTAAGLEKIARAAGPIPKDIPQNMKSQLGFFFNMWRHLHPLPQNTTETFDAGVGVAAMAALGAMGVPLSTETFPLYYGVYQSIFKARFAHRGVRATSAGASAIPAGAAGAVAAEGSEKKENKSK